MQPLPAPQDEALTPGDLHTQLSVSIRFSSDLRCTPRWCALQRDMKHWLAACRVHAHRARSTITTGQSAQEPDGRIQVHL